MPQVLRSVNLYSKQVLIFTNWQYFEKSINSLIFFYTKQDRSFFIKLLA